MNSTTFPLADQLAIQLPSPEQPLAIEPSHGYQCWVKRDDLLHPVISGNKWRKLQGALLEAQAKDIEHLVSFGGGYSNHLHALGYCCARLKIKLTALIRGNYHQHPTAMLNDLMQWGTELVYLSKVDYRRRSEPEFIAQLQASYPKAMLIPEGGSQAQALPGLNTLVKELNQQYDYVVAPVASGGTLAGLISALPKQCTVLGIAMLKGEGYLEQQVTQLLATQASQNRAQWQICHQFHHGGYAKCPPLLSEFCVRFRQQYNIPLEPVYSGKCFYAFEQLCQQGFFKANSRILVLHTGGLQGAR